ncbi:hypothetical protein Tco_1273981 [Tanacetum coccineum]
MSPLKILHYDPTVLDSGLIPWVRRESEMVIEMMVQQVLNPIMEMMLVVVEEQLMLNILVVGQLASDMIVDEWVLRMFGVVEEVNRIVEQLVKAVGDTEID